MVRAEGLEPPRLSPPEPKSGASTSSATPAARAGLTRPILLSTRSISACSCRAIGKIGALAVWFHLRTTAATAWRRGPPRVEGHCGARVTRLRRRAQAKIARVQDIWRHNLGRRNLAHEQAVFAADHSLALSPSAARQNGTNGVTPTRRIVLGGGLAAALWRLGAPARAPVMGRRRSAFSTSKRRRDEASTHSCPAEPAAACAYNWAIPGPLIRLRQGEELKLRLSNRLADRPR